MNLMFTLLSILSVSYFDKLAHFSWIPFPQSHTNATKTAAISKFPLEMEGKDT